MPTYQYQCTECGEALEVVQKFTDDALTICPACQGKLRKVYSAVGIVFKGSGFYRTDSRNGSSTVAAGKDGAANGSSSENGSSGGSDSAAGGASKDGAAAKDSGGSKTTSSAPAADKKSGPVSTATAS